MANTVEIIVKAVDQTKGAFSGLSGSLIGLNQGLELARKGFQALGDIYRATVTDTSNYISSVTDMSRVLGLNTEETSRLIQASDDLFLTQEKLQLGLVAASRQGIDVSIKGLQKLSEQYLTLQPGVERAQFLLKTFGRSGADMGKLMEVGADGIRTMMNAIDDGLVVTEDAKQKNIEYKQLLDSLSDSWTALKVNVGTGVIPGLVDFLNLLNDLSSGHKTAAKAAADYLNKIFQGTSMESEYSKRLREQMTIREEVLAAGQKYFAQLEGQEKAAGRLNAAMDTEDQVFERVAKSAEKVSGALMGAAFSSKPFVSDIRALADIDPSFGDQIAGSIEKIKFAMSGGTTLQGLTQQVETLFSAGKMKGPEALQWLNDLAVANAALSVKTGELTSNQAKQIIVDTLRVTYAEAGAILADFVKNYDGKVMNMTVAIKYTGFSGGAYSSLPIEIREQIENTDLNGNGIIGRAGGGPVWGNTPYVVGERGPELFVPDKNGTIVPNKNLGGSTVTFYGDAYFAVDRELTAQDIMKQMRVEA